MILAEYLDGCVRLLAFSCALQAVENYGVAGVYPLRFGRTIAVVQLFMCLVTLADPGYAPVTLPFVLWGTVSAAARWGGSFNGGADAMTFIPLLLAWLAKSAESAFVGDGRVSQFFMGYVALQAVLSYFLAGVGKVRDADWRSGAAVVALATDSAYPVPERWGAFLAAPGRARVAAAVTIAFELLFPLALLWPAATPVFLAAGFIFHVANVGALGLNRFLWAWLATYPAILYASRYIF